MKNSLIVIFGFAIIIFLLAFIYPLKSQFAGYQSVTYKLNGKNYRFLVADTEQKRELGLMFVKKMIRYDGMIFLFPQTDYQGFWNKNTLTDLTLYWLKDDYLIGSSKLPSIYKTKEPYTIFSPEPANKVIELMPGR